MSTSQERPGVYSSFDASSLIQGSEGAKSVGAVGQAASGTALTAVLCTTAAQAEAAFGSSSDGLGLYELVKLALQNGAASVTAVPAAVGAAPTLTQYTQALELLKDADVDIIICDSGEATVHQALLEHVEDCSEDRQERIAVVSPASGETAAELIARAAALNSERMVLVAPVSASAAGTAADNGALAAAAAAGAIAAEQDPAIPLGGAELEGLEGLETRYDEATLDLLIQGGVTPLETVGGTVSVIRGVTTRTSTGGVTDSTWRELNTVLIVDNVIPAVRDSLRAKFLRSKNTTQTRSAIASQVVLILEDKVSREIIDSYDSVSVSMDTEDPTRCIVEFHFTVAHGLNRIYIAAHITV